MLRYDFEESVGYWIFSTAHIMSRAMNEELATLGITYRQWEVLCWLSYVGQITQSQLAEQMRVEAPTLVGVIDRMERDGWISREPDPNDRRKKILRATEKVQPDWEKMVECARRVRAKALEGIPLDQVEIVKNALGIMRENLLAAHPSDLPTEPVGQAQPQE
ncbi:MAG: MarR family transcriptional regulator [Blastopirellula sp.]|nr:MAG: MarR family transcriptional regulator [Blastopirellula sp.]